MRLMKTIIPSTQILSVLVASVLLASCAASSNNLMTTDTNPEQSSSTNRSSDGLTAKQKKIFSKNSELGYVATHYVYKIKSSDSLDISVFQADELSRKLVVNSQGNIVFPLIGKVRVAGLSQEQIEAKLAAKLGAKYLYNPQVSVAVGNKSNRKVTLDGSVKKPGIYPIEGNITLIQAIALAGGLNEIADDEKIILFRKSTNKAYLLDLKKIRAGQARDPYMTADDRVIVSKSGTRSFIRDASSILGGVLSPLSGAF